jgi:CRISPR/Cas system-associated protein endoribonuclease Cas2
MCRRKHKPKRGSFNLLEIIKKIYEALRILRTIKDAWEWLNAIIPDEFWEFVKSIFFRD